MSTILDGLAGVLGLMDILIFGKDQTEHDNGLTVVLERIQAVAVMLCLIIANASFTKPP